ncbi:MAG TPA: M48 family metallopeptidase [Candidatus Angelobacter sp.]|nr:M48 family metallopeptidase [Candidatus Angelobacter sp.]
MSLPIPNTQPDTNEARLYNRLKRRLELADMVVGLGFLLVLLTTGWSVRLRDISIRAAGDNYALQLFFYVFMLSVISKMLTSGLDFYGFQLEHRFHLSNLKLSAWVRDEMKGWIVGLILSAALAEIVYGLMRVSPAYWWIIAWVVFLALMVFFMQVAPVVLFPLFYKFSPLQNEELKARLTRLGERAGTRVRGVYEWKLSAKTNKANAALTGLGATRRIILADTLLQNYTDDEIEAVLAHELGHHVHRHIFKSILVEAAITLAGFWVGNWALQYAIYQRNMFRFYSLTDFANLPLLVLVSTILSIVLMPALNAFSRFSERQADRYCWQSVSSVTPFISAMEKLNTQNLSERTPSRIVEVLFHSHPPISKRISAAEHWMRKNRPSLAT